MGNRGHLADVDHTWTLRSHDEWRLLDSVMADRQDEIGTVDRIPEYITRAKD
jgi:hypothetical protein